jgi:hypothetical protein
MRLIWFFLAMSFAQPSLAFNFSEKDKQLHIASSVGMTLTGYTAFRYVGWDKKRALWTAAFISTTVGMIKEITDAKPDREDLEADLFGTSVAAMIPLYIYEW